MPLSPWAQGQAQDLVLAGAFKLETCQRTLWVTPGIGPQSDLVHAEIFRGIDAYRFLLRVATGLESEIQGETDIFGQFKEAWQKYESSGIAWATELRPWIHKVYEDTKEIRSRFLHHVGGASYGSLVRKLIRHHSDAEPSLEPILIVGAGQIAQSVAPWLAEHELWLWNRSDTALKLMKADLESRGATVRAVERTPEAEAAAWRSAGHAVICIPVDPAADEIRIHEWMQGMHPNLRSVIHLGAQSQECGAWAKVPNFHPLDDLFRLQRQQGEARANQFASAVRACSEKALLRSMGGSATLPHGWEDLAVFESA